MVRKLEWKEGDKFRKRTHAESCKHVPRGKGNMVQRKVLKNFSG